MNKEILEITKEFHDTYEKLASEYTYETREDTKVFDINSNNGKLMYATINEIVSPILKENKILRENAENNDKVVDNVNWENMLLKKENKQLKEQLLVTQTNEESFRLEMKDITKTLGLDEDTLFDDVKVYARSLKDNWNKLKEYLFDIRKRGFALQNLANVTKNTEPGIAILIIINKMQKLEGSDSNGQ